jgi:hypothetical protein
MKSVLIILGFVLFGNISGQAQTVKENIDKQVRSNQTKEQAAKADRYVAKTALQKTDTINVHKRKSNHTGCKNKKAY